MHRTVLLALAFALAGQSLVGPLRAQTSAELPGKADPARIAAGTYAVDSDHTQVAFAVSHFGFTDYRGLLGNCTGTLTLDPNQPAAASLAVDIPLKSVVTTSAALNQHLLGTDFFDAGKFPTASFRSTSIEVEGMQARITGMLTLHGVTKPVTLLARFTGAGTNPMNKAATIGFSATTSIERSAFGITRYVPVVGDKVELTIAAAFERHP